MIRVNRPCVRIFSLLALAVWSVFFLAPAALAEEEPGWKLEYEELCKKTEESMQLSPGELKGLVEKCDLLKAKIEAEPLDETTKKVYLKKLKMCRDLYAFVLESKEEAPKAE